MTIEEFIEARIAEDERIARESGDGEWDYDAQWDRVNTAEDTLYTLYHAEHIARHDPARVLEDQSPALRLILGCHGDSGHGTCWGCSDDLTPVPMPCDELRALASIWRRHRDYRPEWAVDGGGSNP